jgi:hypothetical protein
MEVYYNTLDTGINKEEKEEANTELETGIDEAEKVHNPTATGLFSVHYEKEKEEANMELELGIDEAGKGDNHIASDSSSDHYSTDSPGTVHLVQQPPPMPGLDTHRIPDNPYRQAALGRGGRIPDNPYRQNGPGRGGGIVRKNVSPRTPPGRGTGRGSAQPSSRSTGPKNTGWDYDIKLKCSITRSHISRYDLQLKIKSSSDDEEAQVATHRLLTEFFYIMIQADDTTIMPPYLELDRNHLGINNISSSYLVSELASFPALKNYFSQLYTKLEGGNIYSSLILASSIPPQELLNAAKYKLASLDMGLWLRPTDHEHVSDIEWQLYSSRYQDGQRIAAMFSKELSICVGARWNQIQTTDNNRQTQGIQNPEHVTRALHLERPSH